MEHSEHVATIEREGARLEHAARAVGVDAAVPSCPGWTMADLLAHLGRLHRWVTQIVAERVRDVEVWWDAYEPPGAPELVDWYASGYPELAAALAEAGPHEEVWSWTPFATTGFWARRQANELVVHRWDGERALGADAPVPIEAGRAVDALDEVLELLPYRRRKASIRGDGATIHLHATDADGEWLVRLTPDGPMFTREHAKGDVAARGSASDLLLVVVGRTPPSALEVFGDVSLLERWQRDAAW